MWKLILMSGLLCLATACAPVSAAYVPVEAPTVVSATMTPTPLAVAQAAARPRSADPRIADLWFDMSMAPTLVDLFNEYSDEADIARADHVSLVDLLDKVERGQRLVIFKNAADAEILVPRLADKMDVIGYNLEHGPANRPDEQADPVGSIRRVRALADQYGLKVAMGPDRNFALSHGVALAPYADIFVLQVQRVQTEPETVRDFVVPLVEDLRRANPALQVTIQIRTEGDVHALVELVASLSESIDGVSILTTDETGDVAAELLDALRPLRPDANETLPALPATTETPAALPETPGARRTAPATPLPEATDTASTGDQPVRALLLWTGLLALGVLLTGMATKTVIYFVNSSRKR